MCVLVSVVVVGGGLSFGLKAALLPDCYSQTNIWVTLALICVYLTVHFKTDSDGCLSVDIYRSGHVSVPLFSSSLHHFAFNL